MGVDDTNFIDSSREKKLEIVIESRLMTPSLNDITGKNADIKKRIWGGRWKKELKHQRVYGDLPSDMLLPPVEITVKRYSGHALDWDNFIGGFKPMIDALVSLGFIQNDNPGKLRHGKHEQLPDREEPRVEIYLREV